MNRKVNKVLAGALALTLGASLALPALAADSDESAAVSGDLTFAGTVDTSRIRVKIPTAPSMVLNPFGFEVMQANAFGEPTYVSDLILSVPQRITNLSNADLSVNVTIKDRNDGDLTFDLYDDADARGEFPKYIKENGDVSVDADGNPLPVEEVRDNQGAITTYATRAVIDTDKFSQAADRKAAYLYMEFIATDDENQPDTANVMDNGHVDPTDTSSADSHGYRLVKTRNTWYPVNETVRNYVAGEDTSGDETLSIAERTVGFTGIVPLKTTSQEYAKVAVLRHSMKSVTGATSLWYKFNGVMSHPQDTENSWKATDKVATTVTYNFYPNSDFTDHNQDPLHDDTQTHVAVNYYGKAATADAATGKVYIPFANPAGMVEGLPKDQAIEFLRMEGDIIATAADFKPSGENGATPAKIQFSPYKTMLAIPYSLFADNTKLKEGFPVYFTIAYQYYSTTANKYVRAANMYKMIMPHFTAEAATTTVNVNAFVAANGDVTSQFFKIPDAAGTASTDYLIKTGTTRYVPQSAETSFDNNIAFRTDEVNIVNLTKDLLNDELKKDGNNFTYQVPVKWKDGADVSYKVYNVKVTVVNDDDTMVRVSTPVTINKATIAAGSDPADIYATATDLPNTGTITYTVESGGTGNKALNAGSSATGFDVSVAADGKLQIAKTAVAAAEKGLYELAVKVKSAGDSTVEKTFYIPVIIAD